MARMSLDTRSRVVYLHKSGFKLKDIQLRLKEEDIKVSKKSLCLLLKKYRLHGVVSDLPKRAKQKKLSLQHLKLIDEAITEDDEVSNSDLRALLLQRAGVRISLSTIQRAKRRLGLYITKKMFLLTIRTMHHNICIQYLIFYFRLGFLSSPLLSNNKGCQQGEEVIVVSTAACKS